MSAPVAPTPVPTWTGVDVLYAAADGTGGAAVTLWTVPQPADADGSADALRRVCDEHARSVRELGGWEVTEPVERPDGSGGAFLTRRLTRETESGDETVAGYWVGPYGVNVALASGGAAPDDDGTGDPAQLLGVLDDFVLASRPSFALSSEEVLALCAVTGFAAPPLRPTSYPPDASEEVRAAAHASALASLLARGLLARRGGELRPDAALRSALALLLDGDRSLLLTVQRPEGSATNLLGGRDGRVAELAPDEHGSLVLTTTGPGRLVQRYAAWLALGRTEPPDGEAFRTSVANLRTSVGSSHPGAGRLSGARQLVSLRGLRRLGEETSVFESTWVEDADGGLWTITLTQDPSTAELNPAGASSVTDGLTRALDFSTS